jgi:hypothetical protein
MDGCSMLVVMVQVDCLEKLQPFIAADKVDLTSIHTTQRRYPHSSNPDLKMQTWLLSPGSATHYLLATQCKAAVL